MAPNENPRFSGALAPEKRTIVIVARHGERLDYYLRDKPDDSNFIPTADRPWDPPLSERGRLQGRALGTYLATITPELGLGNVSGVYSSPLIRCCQTAAEAIVGYNNHIKKAVGGSNTKNDDVYVQVEPGVVESMNENWYRSWSLDGSNGSWGGPPNLGDPDNLKRDDRSNHPSHTLLRGGKEVHSYFSSNPDADSRDDSIQFCYNPTNQIPHQDLASIISPTEDSIFKYPSNETNPINETTSPPPPLPTDVQAPSCSFTYHWNNFESSIGQQDRMHHVIESLAQKHPGETILVVSHGGPVTHLFERLMKKEWKEHGLATYACFSVYEKITVESSCQNNLEEEKGGGGEEPYWNSLVVNESCHVDAMKLESEKESTNKVDFFE